MTNTIGHGLSAKGYMATRSIAALCNLRTHQQAKKSARPRLLEHATPRSPSAKRRGKLSSSICSTSSRAALCLSHRCFLATSQDDLSSPSTRTGSFATHDELHIHVYNLGATRNITSLLAVRHRNLRTFFVSACFQAAFDTEATNYHTPLTIPLSTDFVARLICGEGALG